MSDAAMPENASDPVERQVDAYNRKDIDAFLSCYAPDTVVEDATGTVLMRGHEAMRTAYRDLFRGSPNLHAEISTRIRVGKYIVDDERITGRGSSAEELRAVAIYHIANDLIDHVRLIRDDETGGEPRGGVTGRKGVSMRLWSLAVRRPTQLRRRLRHFRLGGDPGRTKRSSGAGAPRSRRRSIP